MKKSFGILLALVLVVSLALSGVAFSSSPVEPPRTPMDYDVIIINGTVIDGSGAAGYQADIAIKDGKIVAVLPHLMPPGLDRANPPGLDKANPPGLDRAEVVIDATGMVVTPGFIDTHTHQDGTIKRRPESLNFVFDGVTTVLGGMCGGSRWPIGEDLDECEAMDIGVNFATLVGQGTIRRAVIGSGDVDPTPEELEQMKAMVAQAMEEGAFGLSTGLFFIPGCFTQTEEVFELAKVAAAYGGIYMSHQRDEAAGIIDSVAENIRIAEEAGLPGQISHFKIVGFPNWEKVDIMIGMIEEAHARGVDFTADQYPYDTSSTGISSALIPVWAREGGLDAFKERMADPETAELIREGIIYLLVNERGGNDPARVRLSSCWFEPDWVGKTLADILIMQGKAVTIENACELVIYIHLNGGAGGLFTCMSDANIVKIMSQPFVMVCSDSSTPRFGVGSPHPRAYGSNARVLAYYVRERGVITLEEAIRKMTSLPAQRLGLDDRGLVRPGMWADIVVFDPDTVTDKATFFEPHQYSEGFEWVLINGEVVIDQGEYTGILAGKVLRHQ